MIEKRSRKWFLTLLVFYVSTAITFFPPLLSVWLFNAKTPLIILGSTEYVSLITLIVSVYFAGNVMEKKITGETAKQDVNENEEEDNKSA